MKKLICSRIDIVSRKKVKKIEDNNWELQDGESPITILADQGVQYELTVSDSDGVPIATETVTVSAANEKIDNLLTGALKYFILKIYSPEETIIVGDLRYPASKDLSQTKTTTLTFTVKKPA